MQLSLFNLFGFRTQTPSKKKAHCFSHSTKATDGRLQQLWRDLRENYFPDRYDIDNYDVRFSVRRQKRTLGSCNITKRRVRMAKELADLVHERWLKAVLYHEMCHAIIGNSPSNYCGRRQWHGPEFKKLVNLYPDTHYLEIWMKSGGWRRAVRSDRASRK